MSSDERKRQNERQKNMEGERKRKSRRSTERDSNALTKGVKERLIDRKMHKRKARQLGKRVER